MPARAVEHWRRLICVQKNREKILLLALFGTVVLCFVCIRFIFHKDQRPGRARGYGADGREFRFSNRTSELGTAASSTAAKAIPVTVFAGEYTSDFRRAINRGSTNAPCWPNGALFYLRRFSAGTVPSEAIGVVDMDRLLAVHPPTADTQEARANAVGDIQRATALCVAVHDCVVVLDYSGDSQSGVAVVLSAIETFDLTEEVVEQLGQ
jgi:hypothetical protein